METRHAWMAGLILPLLCTAARLDALVFSEIHYNPRPGNEALEFLEITNEHFAPEDISGYALVDGIRYVFPPATILRERESIVVCFDVDALKARHGIDNAVGNYEGRLDADGERLTLVNQTGIVLRSLRYRDDGKWPVGPDGTGHTLVLKQLHTDPGEPENWTLSPELGGSPGRANFPDNRENRQPEFEATVHVDVGAEWRYRKGIGAFSDPPGAWRERDFDDGNWLVGPSGFGFADDDDETVLTDMRRGYTTLAIRKRFEMTREQLDTPGDFFLGVNFDDGFCAYLNGVEVARANCPGGASWDGIANRTREASSEALFLIDPDAFQAGDNALAILGFNRSLIGNDFSLIPRLLTRLLIEEQGPLRSRVRFNELFGSDGGEEGWLELYNDGKFAADLSGIGVTDDPDRIDPHILAAGTVLAPGSFLVLGETEAGLDFSTPKVKLFLLSPDGLVLTAAAFDRVAPSELEPGRFSKACFPDGSDRVWVTDILTPGAANEVPRTTDLVINEIYYHPPEGRWGEFIELHNRGASPIDASGFRFTRGITYSIPDGTVVAPGQYLVVAEDPDLLALHHDHDDALGPYEGQLADSGENIRLVDQRGNIVDEVRYWDGGRWSFWADGRGASLELIDPHQDNDVAAAWDASDETDKTRWEKLSYSVPEYAPAGESEFHILLVERGICRIDDVSIVPAAGGANVIPNAGFDGDTTPWNIAGTHIDSHRITTDSHSGPGCLEIVATGKGDSSCNRIETDTSPQLLRQAYEVSLWARWIRGSSLLVVHGEFAAGPSWWGEPGDLNLSNNSLGARLRMTVPWDLGTPGKENSVRRKLRQETGSDNLGPVIAEVRHFPVNPGEAEPVTIVARVRDSDGVATVRAFYEQDPTNDMFQAALLFDDGDHNDGDANDGLYGGRILAGRAGVLPAESKVVYYVEAEDTLGATGRFPVSAPEKTCVFTAMRGATEQIHILISSALAGELRTRHLHSNTLLDTTVIFDDREAYYNVGVRYRGSPWGRPSQQNFRVRFAKDKPFLAERSAYNFNRRDRQDGAAHFLIDRFGTAEKPAPAADYKYIETRFNGFAQGNLGLFDPVDRSFIEKWYGEEAADGAVALKATGRFQFNDECAEPVWDAAWLVHGGEKSENYRFYWFHSVHQTRDNWDPWFSLTKLLDASTPDAEFERELVNHVDVERFLRVLAPRILMRDRDGFPVGAGHNGYMMWDPTAGPSGLWSLLPFDMGTAFFNTGISLFRVKDRGCKRLLSGTMTLRTYLRIVHEQVEHGYWSPDRAGPFLRALQQSESIGGSIIDFLDVTSTALRSVLEGFTSVGIRILTRDGIGFGSPAARVELEGEAAVQITQMLYSRDDSDFLPFTPTFTSPANPTRWRASFHLLRGENRFSFIGFDSAGGVVDAAEITVSLGVSFVRGDADGSSRLNINDAVTILRHLFGDRAIDCRDAADVDDSGTLEITDAVNLLQHLFLRGAPPTLPYPAAGADPTGDGLDCQRS